jgi:predicted nucleotidyltransferase
MTRDEAIRRLTSRQAELRQLGVERLYLFGSIADDRGDDDSDVDLFFDHQKGKLGLY